MAANVLLKNQVIFCFINDMYICNANKERLSNKHILLKKRSAAISYFEVILCDQKCVLIKIEKELKSGYVLYSYLGNIK